MPNIVVDNNVEIRERAFFPVALNQVIAVGDLVWFDGTTLKSAADFTWDTSDAKTRRKIKKDFAGVALDAHRNGDLAGILPVAVVCEADASAASSSPTFPGLIGIAGDGAAALINQKVILVTDPREAIGAVLRKYTSQTTLRVMISGNQAGIRGHTYADAKVLTLPAPILTAIVDLLTDIPVSQLFGGAVEILAFGFVVTTIIAGADPFTVNIEKGAVNLADLTVAGGAVVGSFTEVDLSADANRKFGAEDLFSIEESAATASGAGYFYIRYRPLS
jgi:hypothetical protein